MFTGIVEEVGSLVDRENRGDSAVLRIRAAKVLEGVALGDSIAVNGVCLTVTGVRDGEWQADVMAETLHRSGLGALTGGDPVNLERAATLSTRLGGHLVQGHVDGLGTVLSRTPGAHWELVRIALPRELARYVVEKGSVTVDGVSLTVSAIGDARDDARDDAPADGPWFEVSLIPTTLRGTTLGERPPGTTVNLEVDVIAKHVERLMGASR